MIKYFIRFEFIIRKGEGKKKKFEEKNVYINWTVLVDTQLQPQKKKEKGQSSPQINNINLTENKKMVL